MEMPSISSAPRTVEDIFKGFSDRRSTIVHVLTSDVDEFYSICDPGMNNLDGGNRICERDTYALLSRVKEIENRNAELENENCLLLSQAVQLFKLYFGGAFDEDAIRNNFVLIYELLDETEDKCQKEER